MRTTIDIPDAIYRELKIKAAREGKTVRELVLRGVDYLVDANATKPAPRLTHPILVSHAPGTIDLTNEQIYDLIGFP